MISKLKAILTDERVLEGELLKNHTTFKIGGAAKALLVIEDTEELIKTLNILKEGNEQFLVLGNGSNLLVSDEGYEGYVIKLSGSLGKIEVEDACINAGGGAMLVRVCTQARDCELSGLEFAYGIPGTVGGAMVMNAGAYGGEMKDVVESVTILNDNMEVETITADQMKFGYRYSLLKEKFGIVLEAKFSLAKGDKSIISDTMNDIMGRRKSKQPLEFPSAGSTFKRPEGAFAGKLIEDAGLRGFRVGGACVSEKHCGFVINDQNATAKDVSLLMDEIVKKVKESSGFILEPEVIKIGKFN